ncbi:MAG: RNA-binding S4 domain-containing protein [Zoogloeaceae bacterium]|jgi:ribosome-associated protein|nr:RNA-binding S4 domain-containing protein [Zoogloeaceae bacterium]
MKNQTFVVRGDYIQLDQLLKAAGLSASGGEAHATTARGEVQVDGKPETRKRAKLKPGQVVECGGMRLTLTEA